MTKVLYLANNQNTKNILWNQTKWCFNLNPAELDVP